ncbi:MAG: radical SAM protein [Alteromonadaceae bacterium]|nr:radical SAM protein [Alteromonadaceae bacterium]
MGFSMARSKGYDPIILAKKTEEIVVKGNQRKYVQLGRHLRFYGGTSSATEVGCNLRCKFCFSQEPVWKPASTGKFFSPQEVFDGLVSNAKKHGNKIISASASEGTLGREHLFELLRLVDETDYVYVLETNGMTLGADVEYCKALAQFKNLHVRVSIKGCNEEEFHTLTGARKEAYELPYQALKNLVDAGVSVNACLMVSFSDENTMKQAREKLFNTHPGLLKSVELERIKQFPRVSARLNKNNLKANQQISCVNI